MGYTEQWKKLLTEFLEDYKEKHKLPPMAIEELGSFLDYVINTKDPHKTEVTWGQVEVFLKNFKVNPTDEELLDAQTLGICARMFIQHVLLFDDFVSKGNLRYGRKTWSNLQNHNAGVAVYDALEFESAILFVLRKYFGKRPLLHSQLLDHLLEAKQVTWSGYRLKTICTMAFTKEHTRREFTWENYRLQAERKCCWAFLVLPMGWAMILSGLSKTPDQEIFKKVESLCGQMAYLAAVIDDFYDVFPAKKKEVDELFSDIKHGQLSWLYLTAFDNCKNEEQRDILETFYGIDNELSVSKIRAIYVELNLPELFEKFRNEEYKRIGEAIDQAFPNHKAAQMLHWFNNFNNTIW